MLRLAVPILPEHIWKDIDEKQVTTFDNDEDAGRRRAVRADRVQDRPVLRLDGQQVLLGRRAEDRRARLRVFANAEALVQALKQGEIDMAHDARRRPFDSLKNTPGITTERRRSTPASTSWPSTSAPRLTDGKPIGDGHPALQGQAGPAGASPTPIDRKTLVDRVLGGYGTPATGVIPPIYPNLTLRARPTARRTLRPRPRPTGCSTRPATQGRATASGTMPDGDGKLEFRLFGRQESDTSQQAVQFMQGWLSDIGIADRGQDHVRGPA